MLGRIGDAPHHGVVRRWRCFRLSRPPGVCRGWQIGLMMRLSDDNDVHWNRRNISIRLSTTRVTGWDEKYHNDTNNRNNNESWRRVSHRWKRNERYWFDDVHRRWKGTSFALRSCYLPRRWRRERMSCVKRTFFSLSLAIYQKHIAVIYRDWGIWRFQIFHEWEILLRSLFFAFFNGDTHVFDDLRRRSELKKKNLLFSLLGESKTTSTNLLLVSFVSIRLRKKIYLSRNFARRTEIKIGVIFHWTWLKYGAFSQDFPRKKSRQPFDLDAMKKEVQIQLDFIEKLFSLNRLRKIKKDKREKETKRKRRKSKPLAQAVRGKHDDDNDKSEQKDLGDKTLKALEHWMCHVRTKN